MVHEESKLFDLYYFKICPDNFRQSNINVAPLSITVHQEISQN